MEEDKKFRHEMKYLISEGEKHAMIEKMKYLIPYDQNAENGIYTIRSLYFDDYWDTAYEEKLEGVSKRSKFRIRIYNFSDQQIKLERKEKDGNFIHKTAVSLTREEVEKIRRRDYSFLLTKQEELYHIFYYQCTTRQLRPRVMVDYEREPFVWDGGNVRITFDSHVRAAFFNDDIFDSTQPVYETLPPGQLILEVKFTEFMPQFIRELIPPDAANLTAASKYVLCYEKIKELH